MTAVRAGGDGPVAEPAAGFDTTITNTMGPAAPLEAATPAGEGDAAGVTPTAAADVQSDLEHQELVADGTRLRTLFTVGLFLWPAFGLLDLAVVTWIEPGELSWYYATRAAGWAVIALAVYRLRRKPHPSRAGLTAIEVGVFCLLIATLTLMCVEYRGITSPYVGGVLVTLAARTAFLAAPWRRGLLVVGLPSAMFPLVLLGAALFSPRVADQFRDPQALATFGESLSFVVGVAMFAVWGGQTAWALRRQVFETRNLGRYRLIKRIGRGGMGEVWSAWHKGLKRQVAVKLLRPERGRVPEAVARFEREVEATTALTHPNTVRLFDYGVTEDGIWYYAMELLEGRNLAALVEAEGPLPPARAVHFATQAARALAEAHALGIVHRDVKPENLFVTHAGGEPDFIKLLDFGIAHIDPGTGAAALTRRQWVAGTPAWMSPEIARGRAADARADVYGLGAVLYFMLTGQPPFTGASAAEILDAHVDRPVVPPGQRRDQPLPADLESVVLRCIAKNPADRFDDGAALAAALQSCADARPR
ncbi:MAG TPA: serine/threonine-protein kinase [Kofleriaceae bacterium]|nr:serine/threonine-protein kinase [Kofleriaceae bacterium]